METMQDFLWAYQNLFYTLGVNGLLALSMYVMLALGQLSLGSAAFMGIGAYTGALLTLHFKLPLLFVLMASVLVPASFALVIGLPVLRLSGVYLAIVTIGLAEVLRVVYINADFAGGALGLNGIPEKVDGILIYTTLGAILVIFMLITKSKIGRAFEAIRENEDAAKVIGIPATSYKIAAFVISAGIAGLAGAFSAHFSFFISPNEYGFENAINILSYAVLGGISSAVGPVLGAFILTLLPELLRFLSDFRLIANGLIIVLVVIFLPKGVFPFESDGREDKYVENMFSFKKIWWIAGHCRR